jgi:hypothetical protein
MNETPLPQDPPEANNDAGAGCMTRIVRHSLPAACGKCGERKRGFWEVEYEMDCADCREEESRLKTEDRLRKSFAAGKIKESSLTPLGRSICLPNA